MVISFLAQVFWLLSFDHVTLLTVENVDQLEAVFFLCALHQPQIQLVLCVWLSLHSDSVVGQKVAESVHRALDSLLYQLLINLCETVSLQNPIHCVKSVCAVGAFHIGDETSHQLVHSDRDVSCGIFGADLGSKQLEILLYRYKRLI